MWNGKEGGLEGKTVRDGWEGVWKRGVIIWEGNKRRKRKSMKGDGACTLVSLCLILILLMTCFFFFFFFFTHFFFLKNGGRSARAASHPQDTIKPQSDIAL